MLGCQSIGYFVSELMYYFLVNLRICIGCVVCSSLGVIVNEVWLGVRHWSSVYA